MEQIFEWMKEKKWLCSLLFTFILCGVFASLYLVEVTAEEAYVCPKTELTTETTPVKNEEIVVDIKGAVINPGVYHVTEGQIVNDIINLAGGLQEEADKLNIDIKQQIVKNTKAMICHKIGGMVVFSSSNLVLSKFVGLAAVGLYSNYYMVIAALNNFAGKFFEAITASIGNLMVVEESSKKVKAFKFTEFITALQAAICFCGLYVLFNPFVELWVGREYLFDEVVVAAMAFSFYLTYMRKAVLMFRDAAGLYWNDRYKPVAEAIINLTVSIYLTIHYGVIGVVLGGIISTLLTCFWVEPYVLFNNGINIKLRDYYLDYFKFTVVAFAAAFISKMLYSSIFVEVTLLNFIAGILICVSITLVLWLAIFKNREEMTYLMKFVNDILNRK